MCARLCVYYIHACKSIALFAAQTIVAISCPFGCFDMWAFGHAQFIALPCNALMHTHTQTTNTHTHRHTGAQVAHCAHRQLLSAQTKKEALEMHLFRNAIPNAFSLNSSLTVVCCATSPPPPPSYCPYSPPCAVSSCGQQLPPCMAMPHIELQQPKNLTFHKISLALLHGICDPASRGRLLVTVASGRGRVS